MIGPPLTDDELDCIEQAADGVINAIDAGDYDTALIIASTCEQPVMLALFIAEMTTNA